MAVPNIKQGLGIRDLGLGDSKKKWLSPVALNAAEFAIIAGAAAAMLSLYGAGFVCLLGGFLLGWLILRSMASLCRKPLRRRKVSLVLAAIFAGLFVAYAFWQTRPKSLFRAYIADPVPQSVRILHSEYQRSRDPAVYLHFTADANDMDAVLRERTYENAQTRQGPSGNLPDWWDPQSLTDSTMYCWEDSGKSVTWLWVNTERTEAYFARWYF